MGTRGAGIGSVAGAAINFELDYTGSDFVANNASLYNGNIRHIVSQNKKLVHGVLGCRFHWNHHA